MLSTEFQLANYISIRFAQEIPEQSLFGWRIGGIELTGLLRTENTILVVTYLAHLPPEHARASYLAVSGMRNSLAMLVSAITVILSTFLEKLGTTLWIAILGGIGLILFICITPALDKRVKIEQEEGHKKAVSAETAN
ncbi:hypothetical protein EIM92_14610 [Paenibacillus lentus]|uniref:MFS transporter n=1 Tax=Paenibacillus lentus TaxID=1338368 RepID=A0A3S8RX20_9BACL|nr:hypothetical protein EIM92_14610 [Paenibacillus lentus]